MNYTKPLTPALRRQIEEGIERQMMELSECQNTSYVSALRTGLKATKTLIHGLPDGFLIPINGEINQCNDQICALMRGEDFCSKAERREE